MSKMKLLLDVVEDMRKLSDSLQTIAVSIAGITPTSESIPDSIPDSAPQRHTPPQIKLEQVRAALADKSSAGKTEQVKALLRKHGSDRLSGISSDKYPALMEEVEKI